MMPPVPMGIHEIARRLAEDIAPEIAPDYFAFELGKIATLLRLVADRWDIAAHMLVQDNRALRILFAETVPFVNDDQLRDEAGEHIASEDHDLRISALTATNEAMRETLIRWHAAIDAQGDAAKLASDRIWGELAASCRRRAGG